MLKNLTLPLIILFLIACKKEIVPERYLPKHEHDAYRHSLDKAGLMNAALGKDWMKVADGAIQFPLKVETPFAEDFYFDTKKANAIGYRISADRGHKVEIVITPKDINEIKTFLDVFRVDNDSLHHYTHIASAKVDESKIWFEPQIASDYIIRFQTELLRGGQFKMVIHKGPALAFPVDQGANRDIGSLFGAPRDGGRRKHHGVDIFAKRHTPIIAPTEGHVRFAGEKGLGGKVVWMRDTKRDQTLYFAHLQDIMVQDGDEISLGDTLGTVGNSGNARTTAPHLHFGIYKNGPVDPYDFIAFTRVRKKRELAKKELIGSQIRVKENTVLQIDGQFRQSEKMSLLSDQLMKVVGTSAAYYRVRLPDDTMGYVEYNRIENAVKPLSRTSAKNDLEVRIKPLPGAAVISTIEKGTPIEILGENGSFSFISNEAGETGWVDAL